MSSGKTDWRSSITLLQEILNGLCKRVPSLTIGRTLDSVRRLSKTYVVQTSTEAIVERCILMATDPGDLVLDPTCGSGTTAIVAEQWGRRWITIDTSRVALALARARIMGARYPFYLLADSREGQIKEAEVTRTAPSSQPVHGNIRHGFVYERVPHITLKSIANNAEIDVIWDKWQQNARTAARETERRAQETVAGMGDSARCRRSLGCKYPGDFLCTQSRAGTRRGRQCSESLQNGSKRLTAT